MSREEVVSGSRTRDIVRCRSVIGYLAVYRFSIPAVEVGRALSVSVQSIVRGLEKGRELCERFVWTGAELSEKRL